MKTVGYRQMGSKAFDRKSQAITDVRNPPVVTLCGSTRFKRQFIRANRDFTMAGFVVLTVGFFTHADEERYQPTSQEKYQLDQLHKRKIDLSDFIFVLNCEDADGRPYIGSSTQSEIDYARSNMVPVYFLGQQFPFDFINLENYK